MGVRHTHRVKNNFATDRQPRGSVMANESIYTNAQNFPSFANGGVDPRTGLYTFTLSLPTALAGNLTGPEFTLALNFNPIGGDDWGLGAGWSTNLSHVRLGEPRLLKLSTGEQFHIDGSGEEPGISERKLRSFRYLQQGENAAQIVHRSGAVEHLYSPVGGYLVPHMLQSPTGQALHLTYQIDQGRPRLATITNDDGLLLLELTRVDGSLIRIKAPSGQFNLRFADGKLRRLELPAQVGGAWLFEYTGDAEPYANLVQVTQPLGAVERIHYDDRHLVPGNGMPSVPRVSRHEVDAGPGSAVIVSEYRYGNDNHNFLGFGGINDWRGGADNLYRASPGYTYQVLQTQINGDQTRTTTRTYNSFHLLLSEQSQQGQYVTVQETEYHLRPDAPFEAQPAHFQLPRKTTRRWRVEGQPLARSETTLTEFDSEGNLIRELLPSGQETLYTYYPASGETDATGVACPPDPWGFARHYRTITVRPAPEHGAANSSDSEVTHYRHARVDCVESTPGRPAPLGHAVQAVEIRVESTRNGVTARHQQALEYHHSPASEGRHRHGRLKRRQETLWAPDADPTQDPGHTSIEIHDYEKLPTSEPHTAHHQLRTAVHYTAVDGSEQQALRLQDIATGLTLMSQDHEGTQVTYTYDALQRLTSARVEDALAPAERTFSYLNASAAGVPEAEFTSSTGVKTRTLYDRLGREVKRLREEGWQAGENEAAEQGLFWECRYDGFGRVVEEVNYDDCGDNAAKVRLAQVYEYDAWGRVAATVLPDGTREVTQTSPFGKEGYVTERWLESAPGDAGQRERQARTRTELGVFEKPVRTEVFTPEGNLEHSMTYRYDGWGQCVEQTEQYRVGNVTGPALTTTMSYDPWGRLHKTVQPNKDVFTQGYAEHSREGWVSQIAFGAAGATPQPLATRVFDGLGRVTEQHQGGRTLRYGYEGGSPLVRWQDLPDRKRVEHTYRPSLTDTPITSSGDDLHFAFDYDPVTAQLVGAKPTDAQGRALQQEGLLSNAYEYAKTGHLLKETRIEGANAYTTGYSQSFAGRRLGRTDSEAGSEQFRYDAFGRLRQQAVLAEQGSTEELVRLGYDAFGQLDQRECAGVTTQSRFDVFGREIERTIMRGDERLRGYTYAYNGNGNLAQRLTFDEHGEQLLREAYEYDSRNRLTVQTNEGAPDALPRDRDGQPVVMQLFEFDALDNLTLVLSNHPNGSSQMTQAYFAEHDPCQLSRLVHTQMTADRAVQRASEETFEYDANGRLASRSGGWRLEYDSFGRLASLSQPQGSPRAYHYDPQGTLCAVSTGADKHHRFYDGLAAHHLRRGAQVQRYLTAAGTPVALLDGTATPAVPLVTDRNASVTGEWRENALHTAVYDAYGVSHGESSLTCELGFNGELREGPGSDLYLLGRGYRLYDAALMRFLAPDSASPFEEGGLNPYAYCRGNPVMLHDPTGHMPQWTAANLPYYVAPPEEQQQSGGLLGGILKLVSWAFLAHEAFSVVKLGWLAATAATGGLMAVGAAAVGLSAVALGVNLASIVDEDNDVLIYTAFWLGASSWFTASGASKALTAKRGASAITPRRNSGTGLNFDDNFHRGPRPDIADNPIYQPSTRPSTPAPSTMGRTSITPPGQFSRRSSANSGSLTSRSSRITEPKPGRPTPEESAIATAQARSQAAAKRHNLPPAEPPVATTGSGRAGEAKVWSSPFIDAEKNGGFKGIRNPSQWTDPHF